MSSMAAHQCPRRAILTICCCSMLRWQINYIYSQNLPTRALPTAEIDLPEGGAVVVETSAQDQKPELMIP